MEKDEKEVVDWKRYKLKEKITEILKEAGYEKKPQIYEYYYLTPYQIAQEFSKKYQSELKKIGKTLGGSGTGGEGDSLPRYISLELSKRITSGEITDIEWAQLSQEHIKEIKFDEEIIASNIEWGYNISMYRYKKNR